MTAQARVSSGSARLCRWERSRVSHHVKRMARRGLVEKTECAEDGRGAFVTITPAGRAAIEQAAPGPVRAVRRLLFDALGSAEVDPLRTVIDKLAARLEAATGDASSA